MLGESPYDRTRRRRPVSDLPVDAEHREPARLHVLPLWAGRLRRAVPAVSGAPGLEMQRVRERRSEHRKWERGEGRGTFRLTNLSRLPSPRFLSTVRSSAIA